MPLINNPDQPEPPGRAGRPWPPRTQAAHRIVIRRTGRGTRTAAILSPQGLGFLRLAVVDWGAGVYHINTGRNGDEPERSGESIRCPDGGGPRDRPDGLWRPGHGSPGHRRGGTTDFRVGAAITSRRHRAGPAARPTGPAGDGGRSGRRPGGSDAP